MEIKLFIYIVYIYCMYFKLIMELEQKNEELMKSIQELQLSRPNIRTEIFPDVFLKSDKWVDEDIETELLRQTVLYHKQFLCPQLTQEHCQALQLKHSQVIQ